MIGVATTLYIHNPELLSSNLAWDTCYSDRVSRFSSEPPANAGNLSKIRQ